MKFDFSGIFPVKIIATAVILCLCIFLFYIFIEDKEKGIQKQYPTVNVVQQIESRKTLKALTTQSSINYFIYRGHPTGYAYEMLQDLAKSLNVDLEISIENDLTKAWEKINSGEYDIIATDLTITKERKKKFKFLSPHIKSRQILIQNTIKPKSKKKRKKIIRNPLDLAHKTIIISSGTIFKSRLEHLSEEIGDTIIIKEEKKPVEDLIKEVAKNKIDYTICDEHIAKVAKKYYPSLYIKTPISSPQKIAWAISKLSDSTSIAKLNQWMLKYSKSKKSAILYDKYYRSRFAPKKILKRYRNVQKGQISKYDKTVKEIAQEYNLDWRLLSSIIYQESEFKPKSKSKVGAYGLMQLMPYIMKKYNIDSSSSAKEHIRSGVRYIHYLYDRMPDEIQDSTQRIKFALASYNAGIAHVYDARRLAKKHGKDPDIWDDNVEILLKNKSKPKYYKDQVVKYGKCRGIETYEFVREIFSRYHNYCNHFDKDEAKEE
ncbi:MAG: transglycosylase SLT domain-containing protein [Bacteroidales bacterium]